jgi:hypothetical protein
LVLIPVNLGGVAKSLRQAITGKPSIFKRTPKVVGRTAAPWIYVAFELALVIWWTLGLIFGFLQNHPVSATLAGLHALLLGYGLVRFIGVDAMNEDLQVGLGEVFPSNPARDVQSAAVKTLPAPDFMTGADAQPERSAKSA